MVLSIGRTCCGHFQCVSIPRLKYILHSKEISGFFSAESFCFTEITLIFTLLNMVPYTSHNHAENGIFHLPQDPQDNPTKRFRRRKIDFLYRRRLNVSFFFFFFLKAVIPSSTQTPHRKNSTMDQNRNHNHHLHFPKKLVLSTSFGPLCSPRCVLHIRNDRFPPTCRRSRVR